MTALTMTRDSAIKAVILAFMHEMGHLLMSLILGLDARLGINSFSVFTYNYTTTRLQTFLVAAGGLLCIPFGIYLWNEEEGQDRDEWMIVTVVMFLYSVIEVVWFTWLR